jgi:hypothetical protein
MGIIYHFDSIANKNRLERGENMGLNGEQKAEKGREKSGEHEEYI